MSALRLSVLIALTLALLGGSLASARASSLWMASERHSPSELRYESNNPSPSGSITRHP